MNRSNERTRVPTATGNELLRRLLANDHMPVEFISFQQFSTEEEKKGENQMSKSEYNDVRGGSCDEKKKKKKRRKKNVQK